MASISSRPQCVNMSNINALVRPTISHVRRDIITHTNVTRFSDWKSFLRTPGEHPRNFHTVGISFCFVVFLCRWKFPMSVAITPLSLGRSCDCPGTSEATMRKRGQSCYSTLPTDGVAKSKEQMHTNGTYFQMKSPMKSTHFQPLDASFSI